MDVQATLRVTRVEGRLWCPARIDVVWTPSRGMRTTHVQRLVDFELLLPPASAGDALRLAAAQLWPTGQR